MTYIQHTTLEVDPKRSADTIEFYVTMFGLTPMETPIPFSQWFREKLHLYWGSGAVQSLNGEPAARHVAFVMGRDYPRVRRMAMEDGSWIGDATEYWGSQRGYIQDPSGNRVEVMQWPPHEPQ